MRNSGIGFIGLGQMGLGMANNLAKIAAPFYAYDAVPAATDRLDGDDIIIAGFRMLPVGKGVMLLVSAT